MPADGQVSGVPVCLSCLLILPSDAAECPKCGAGRGRLLHLRFAKGAIPAPPPPPKPTRRPPAPGSKTVPVCIPCMLALRAGAALCPRCEGDRILDVELDKGAGPAREYLPDALRAVFDVPGDRLIGPSWALRVCKRCHERHGQSASTCRACGAADLYCVVVAELSEPADEDDDTPEPPPTKPKSRWAQLVVHRCEDCFEEHLLPTATCRACGSADIALDTVDDPSTEAILCAMGYGEQVAAAQEEDEALRSSWGLPRRGPYCDGCGQRSSDLSPCRRCNVRVCPACLTCPECDRPIRR